MKAVAKLVFLVVAVMSCTLVFPVPSHAGFLDRLKKKAEEATQEVRDVREDVQDVTSADDRARSEVQSEQRAAQHEIESATDLEGQARGAVQNSEPGRTVGELQSEVVSLETADERAAAQVQHEAAVAEHAISAATDVEHRAEQAVLTSQAGRTVVQTEQRVEYVEQTDERVQANAQRRADESLGVSETQRDVRETQRALDNLGNALD
jgi:hypothetical protein